MKTQFAMALLILTVFGYGCSSGGAEQRAEEPTTDPAAAATQEETHGSKVREVKLTTPLDPVMVTKGKEIYDMKCAACHRLTDERLVGPGWKSVTTRRKPEWIMNMILNVDMMLADDTEAQKMLEQCLVRMPNQNLSESDARSVLEYMRQNDGEK